MKTNLGAMALVICLVLCSHAGATVLTWDANTGSGGIQDGTGNWVNGGTNWQNAGSNVAWDNSTPDMAIIGANGGAAGTISLTGPITVDDITFNAASSGNYIVTGNTLTLAGVGTPLITTNVSATINSQLAGSLGFTKSGNGTLTLGGSVGNSYSGLVSVNAGTLTMNKSAGNVIIGDVTIQSGGNLAYSSGRSNQIDNASTVTMSGATSTLNFAGATATTSITETFANLIISGGTFSTGFGSNWNVTGTANFTGGAGNIKFIGNSGSGQTFNSLALSGMTGTTGDGTPNNSFALFGNSTTQSRITVGSGGLTLDGSNMFIRKGNIVGTLGSRLVLDGNVTTTGSTMSRISHDPLAAGTIEGTQSVQLSSTAAAVNRTFNIGGGGADLEVTVPITNGASSAGGIIKTGLGTLLLNAANNYTGNTLVSAGTLGGTGTSTSDFIIAGGTLSPGNSAGTLLTDDLTIQSNGSLLIELGGLTAGTQHDQVVSAGTTTLGGTLIINLIDGFTPTPSDTFTIMLANSVIGEFDNVFAPGAGGNFDVLYFGNMVQLTNFQLLPEPSSLTLLGLSILGLFASRRRKTIPTSGNRC